MAETFGHSWTSQATSSITNIFATHSLYLLNIKRTGPQGAVTFMHTAFFASVQGKPQCFLYPAQA